MSLNRYNRGLMQDPTTALRFACHGTVGGALTAVVDGATYAAAAVLDAYGMGTVDITGLTPGATYTVELQEDGATDFTLTAKTCPANTMRLHWFSCVQDNAPFFAGYAMRDRGPDAIIDLGDNPYSAATASTDWQAVANNTQVLPLTEQSYLDVHNRTLKNPGMIAIRNFAYGYMYDDHDVAAGDDWDHTIAQAQVQNDISGNDGVSSPPTQPEVNDVFALGIGVIRELRTMGNPTNADAGVAAQTPSQALIGDTPTASVYSPNYYRFGNDVVDVLVTDQHTHRDPVVKTDDASKTMLGSTQKTWLKARILASTARVIVWMSGKYVFPTSGELSKDRWSSYSTERDEILQYAEDQGKALLIPSGDKHLPLVGKTTTDATDAYDTQTYNAVNVNASPAGVALTTSARSTYWGDAIIYAGGVSSSLEHQCYGELEITSAQIKYRIMSIHTGLPMFEGVI